MKKSLLFVFSLVSLSVFGQADVAIQITSPAAGTTITPNTSFSFDATITNVGSVDITPSDTVYYYPLINGQSYLYSVSGNDTTRIIYGFTNATIAANGDTVQVSRSFNGLTIGDPSTTQFDLCAGVEVHGTGNWSGPAAEADATNNVSCNTVNYDAGNTSIAEHVIFANIKQKIADNSYYANGSYFLDVVNLENGKGEISAIDMTGRKIRSINREVRGNQLQGEVEMEGLKTGIYIIAITVEGQTVSAKKIMVE